MKAPRPQFLLFVEAQRDASRGCQWRFLLHRLGSDRSIAASDVEPTASRSRTELLALVRGLEAIDEPGDVKLVMKSDYIARGLTRGLNQWRAQGWQWDRFGRRVPIRDCDLWQRVDHALAFHSVDCHAWSEPQSAGSAAPAWCEPDLPVVSNKRRRRRGRMVARTRRTLGSWQRRVGALLDAPLAPTG